MVLQIRWHMLVVRMGAGQGRIIWMGLRVVPIQFLITPVNGVRVVLDASLAKVKSFQHPESNAVLKFQLPLEDRHRSSAGNQDQGRTLDNRELVLESVNEGAVCCQ
jgi:hypothetical protein